VSTDETDEIAKLREQHERDLVLLEKRFEERLALHTRIAQAEAEPGSVKITVTFESKRTSGEAEATMRVLVPLIERGLDAYIRSIGGSEPQSVPLDPSDPSDPFPGGVPPVWYSTERAQEIDDAFGDGEAFLDAVLSAAIEAFDHGLDTDIDSDDYKTFAICYLNERESEFIRLATQDKTLLVRLGRLGATPQFIVALAALLGPAYAPSGGG